MVDTNYTNIFFNNIFIFISRISVNTTIKFKLSLLCQIYQKTLKLCVELILVVKHTNKE